LTTAWRGLRAATPVVAWAVLVGMVLALAGCGGVGGVAARAAGGSAGTVVVTETEFKIEPRTIVAREGQTLTVRNRGTIAHDLVVQGSDQQILARTDLIQPGATAQLRLSQVPPGSYTVFCDVPGHREQGMVATLEVRPTGS